MNVTYPFYCVVQNQENIGVQMFVIYFNGKTLKTHLLQILVTKMIFSRKFGGIYFFPLPVAKIWAYMYRLYCPKSARYFFDQKLLLFRIFKFWRGLWFLRCGWFEILKFVKHLKLSKMCIFYFKTRRKRKKEKK